MRVSRARQRGRALEGKGGGGVEEARRSFSWLGVACTSIHAGSMNRLCLAACCWDESNTYESTRVVWVCKITFRRCLFLRTSGQVQRERAPQSEHQLNQPGETRATVGTGLRAKRATGLAGA